MPEYPHSSTRSDFSQKDMSMSIFMPQEEKGENFKSDIEMGSKLLESWEYQFIVLMNSLML